MQSRVASSQINIHTLIYSAPIQPHIHAHANKFTFVHISVFAEEMGFSAHMPIGQLAACWHGNREPVVGVNCIAAIRERFSSDGIWGFELPRYKECLCLRVATFVWPSVQWRVWFFFLSHFSVLSP